LTPRFFQSHVPAFRGIDLITALAEEIRHVAAGVGIVVYYENRGHRYLLGAHF
jgi:hypothetical protein